MVPEIKDFDHNENIDPFDKKTLRRLLKNRNLTFLNQAGSGLPFWGQLSPNVLPGVSPRHPSSFFVMRKGTKNIFL